MTKDEISAKNFKKDFENHWFDEIRISKLEILRIFIYNPKTETWDQNAKKMIFCKSKLNIKIHNIDSKQNEFKNLKSGFFSN